VAVLQAINKLDAAPSGGTEGTAPVVPFTSDDEYLVGHLAAQVGIILRNCQLYAESQVEQGRVRAMLDIVRGMHGDLGINSLVFTITERTPLLVNADRYSPCICSTSMLSIVSHDTAQHTMCDIVNVCVWLCVWCIALCACACACVCAVGAHCSSWTLRGRSCGP
jgi:hypothetical protein